DLPRLGDRHLIQKLGKRKDGRNENHGQPQESIADGFDKGGSRERGNDGHGMNSARVLAFQNWHNTCLLESKSMGGAAQVRTRPRVSSTPKFGRAAMHVGPVEPRY